MIDHRDVFLLFDSLPFGKTDILFTTEPPPRSVQSAMEYHRIFSITAIHFFAAPISFSAPIGSAFSATPSLFVING